MVYKKYYILVIFIFSTFYAWSYDTIEDLNEKLSSSYAQLKRLQISTDNNNNVNPSFFEYKLQEGENLTSVSSRAGVSISALITVNQSQSISQYQAGDTIIIPSEQGIFLSITPQSDLEFLLNNRLFSTLTNERPIVVKASYDEQSTLFYFLPKSVLKKSEYLLWRDSKFRQPILQGYITSYFGMRVSPITGYKVFHKGLDIAGKSASEIFAARGGTIIERGYNKIYGYHLVIQNDNGYKTLYAHLLDIRVNVGDEVAIGTHIAYLGNSGSSTGPHIHFEILKDDVAIDPLPLLNLE